MNPNIEQIRSNGMRVIRGKIPAAVRKELSNAVKNRELGHLRKDGLKPEIFYHPDQLHEARRRQEREALYAVECIKKVVY